MALANHLSGHPERVEAEVLKADTAEIKYSVEHVGAESATKLLPPMVIPLTHPPLKYLAGRMALIPPVVTTLNKYAALRQNSLILRPKALTFYDDGTPQWAAVPADWRINTLNWYGTVCNPANGETFDFQRAG